MKAWLSRTTLFLSVLVSIHLPASATTWYITPSGPLTIQDAVTSSLNGDTILLSSGTYTGSGNRDIRFWGKAILLASLEGADSTVIDCENSGRGFLFIDGEERSSILMGITITHGLGNRHGGAIYISGSSPTISGVIFKHNYTRCDNEEDPPNCAGGKGGAIYITGGTPVILCNTFIGNQSFGSGGGAIYANQSTAEIIGNRFELNSADDCCWVMPIDEALDGGAIASFGGILFINNNIFYRNWNWDSGHAIVFHQGTHTISNCTFVHNTDVADYSNPLLVAGASVLIENSLFVSNGPSGQVIECEDGGTASLHCSDFFDNSDNPFCVTDSSGNIFLDPLFADYENGDFDLLPGSPCLPEGNACGVHMGAGAPDLYYWVGSMRGDTTQVVPGEPVCHNFRIMPPLKDMQVSFVTSGANSAGGAVMTDQEGIVRLCYTPHYLGADTVTASANFHFCTYCSTSAQHVQILMPPEISFDPAHHSDSDSLLAVSGMTLCGTFLTEPAVADAPITLDVRGANDLEDADIETTDGNGSVTLCYQAAELGIDTMLATATLDYGGVVENITGSLVLISYPPVFEFNPVYHSGRDTVFTQPEDTVCAHFRIIPPMTGITVRAEVSGANTASLSGATDGFGCVVFRYPALHSGVDSVIATAVIDISTVPYHPSAALELMIIGGGIVEPHTTLSTALAPDEDQLLITLTSNKELMDPVVAFEFERQSGDIEHSEKALAKDAGGWIYSTSYAIPNPGSLALAIIAADLYGSTITENRSCDVARTWNALPLDFLSNDGLVGLTAPQGGIVTSGRVLIERQTGWEAIAVNEFGTTLIPVSERFSLSTNGTFGDDPQFSIWYSRYPELTTIPSSADHRKIGIYMQSGSFWTYTGGQGNSERVSAAIHIPGTYAAFLNPEHHIIPSSTFLFQNYPNPFYPSTTIRYEIANPGMVTLRIYDIIGALVAVLDERHREKGIFEVEWAGENKLGEQVSSGLYFYRLQAPGYSRTMKLMLIR